MSRTPPTSPSKRPGVKWFQQALRSFATPYGEAAAFPVDPAKVLNRLQPFTCEWLARPEYAISETAQTIIENMALLQTDEQNVIEPGLVELVKQQFVGAWDSLEAVNNKTPSRCSKKDAKKTISALFADDEFHQAMLKAYQRSAAMFALSGNYLIASTLLQNPALYSRLVTGSSPAVAAFKANPSGTSMKKFLLEFFADERGATPITSESPSLVAKAFQDSSESSDSSDSSESSDEEPQPRSSKRRKSTTTKSKRRKNTLAEIFGEEDVGEEPSPSASGKARSTAGTVDEPKKGKGKGKGKGQKRSADDADADASTSTATSSMPVDEESVKGKGKGKGKKKSKK